MSKGNTENVSIGILGTYGFGNMGDAAVADATIQGILRYVPKAKIIGICQQPVNAKRRHNIDSYSIFSDFIQPENESEEKIESSSGITDSPDISQSQKKNTSISFKKKLINSIKSLPFIYKSVKNMQRKLAVFKDVSRELKYTRTIYKLVKSLDLLIIAGSGQFNEDWGGAWRYPFALFRWVLISRLAGCKVAFFSVGAGNIYSFWGRKFCTWALKLSNYKSLRDQKTLSISRQWGINDAKLVPDMAFSIKFPEQARISEEEKIVGINPIAYCSPKSWHVADLVSYNHYIEKMSMLCSSILADGYRIHFIPNELKMDNPVIDDIVNKMSLNTEQSRLIERPKTETSEDVIRNLSNCNYVIASRFHGLLFSYMAKKPTIALAFHFKYYLLAEEMKQQRYCLDIAEFTPEKVKYLFDELVENCESITKTIAHCSDDYKNLVEQQYQKIHELSA